MVRVMISVLLSFYMGALAQDTTESKPCMSDERYRQFDFWIGEWAVHNQANDKQVGENVITREQDGCMLRESWMSARGSSGTSINYFDPSDEQWKQVWTDASGGIIHYAGSFKEGAMHFAGEYYSQGQGTQLSRMTLTPRNDGTVHQFIENSKDHGTTWAVWFNGIYKPASME